MLKETYYMKGKDIQRGMKPCNTYITFSHLYSNLETWFTCVYPFPQTMLSFSSFLFFQIHYLQEDLHGRSTTPKGKIFSFFLTSFFESWRVRYETFAFDSAIFLFQHWIFSCISSSAENCLSECCLLLIYSCHSRVCPGFHTAWCVQGT